MMLASQFTTWLLILTLSTKALAWAWCALTVSVLCKCHFKPVWSLKLLFFWTSFVWLESQGEGRGWLPLNPSIWHWSLGYLGPHLYVFLFFSRSFGWAFWAWLEAKSSFWVCTNAYRRWFCQCACMATSFMHPLFLKSRRRFSSASFFSERRCKLSFAPQFLNPPVMTLRL